MLEMIFAALAVLAVITLTVIIEILSISNNWTIKPSSIISNIANLFGTIFWSLGTLADIFSVFKNLFVWLFNLLARFWSFFWRSLKRASLWLQSIIFYCIPQAVVIQALVNLQQSTLRLLKSPLKFFKGFYTSIKKYSFPWVSWLSVISSLLIIIVIYQIFQSVRIYGLYVSVTHTREKSSDIGNWLLSVRDGFLIDFNKRSIEYRFVIMCIAIGIPMIISSAFSYCLDKTCPQKSNHFNHFNTRNDKEITVEDLQTTRITRSRTRPSYEH